MSEETCRFICKRNRSFSFLKDENNREENALLVLIFDKNIMQIVRE